MPKAETETARDRILRTASELFYEHGFHAVGVDLIIERAGVAKATLYRHFPTKDDLIAAYLEDADARFSEWFDASINPDATPAEALVGIFDSVAILVTSPACMGCTFQVTAAEFPEASHPGHAVALAHKQAVRGRLRELAMEAGARRPDELADGLLPVDGRSFRCRSYAWPRQPRWPGRCCGTHADRRTHSAVGPIDQAASSPRAVWRGGSKPAAGPAQELLALASGRRR
jgi:AcrR family transcriptional regulator